MYKSNALTSRINKYCASLAKAYSVVTTTKFFSVSGPKEVKLREAILESSDMLQKINMVDVQQVKGETVAIGSDRLSTGRKNNARFAGSEVEIDGYEYELSPTDTVVQISWQKAAPWVNADGGKKFNKLLTSYANKQTASDILRIGWNGTHHAKDTDPVEYPKGQDVNEGWHARVKRLAPDNIVVEDDGAEIYFDPEGKVDGSGNKLSTYQTLDAMASDLKNNNISEEFQDAEGLVVLVGRDLVAAAEYRLYTEADKPTEQIAAQQLVKSIAGMPAYVPGYFPGKRMVITKFDNLSVYTQEGTRRRKVKDNDDKGQIESFYWRFEGYVVEELGLYAAFDEDSVIIGNTGDAPAVPTIDTALSDTSAVIGSPGTFTVVATGATRYEWAVDGVAVSGDDATLDIDTTDMDTGEYSVVVECIGDGGSVTSNAILTVTSA